MLEEPAPLTRRARRGGEDATAVVRAPAAWELLLPTGETAPVTARVIVLGRNPSATEPGAQYVAVSDEARTVSKNHARVEWNGASWSITDLGSTNGVAVVDAAGVEQILPAEGTASVTERFVLGDAVVVLRQTTV
ncbi:FHA domain-containing protein [Microbacterium sp. cx-59]|nr:FHA domain-containing protein [Microbacterium sp. cx-59]